MPKTLLSHQVEDSAFLASRRVAALHNDMGTGKTLTSIAAAQIAAPRRIVVIAPPTAHHMWREEMHDEMPAPYDAITVLKESKLPELRDWGIYIMSYERANKYYKEFKAWLEGNKHSVLICDEAHYLKSKKAQRTKNILGVGNNFAAMSYGAGYTWLLTGTPMTRWADDLFPFLTRCKADELHKVLYGHVKLRRDGIPMAVNIVHFMEKFATGYEDAYGFKQTGGQNLDLLQNMLYTDKYGEQIAVRRTIDSVVDSMPPITHNDYWVELAESELVEQLKHETLEGLLAKYKKSTQDNEWATLRRGLGEAKIPAAVAHIKEQLELGYKPFLIGAWHKSVIYAVHKSLSASKFNGAVITGETKQEHRAIYVQQFNSGELDFLIGQILTMGVSLNLQQGGNRIIAIEESVSPQDMKQFYARLWRYGQQKHVQVDILRGDISMEHAIMSLNKRKDKAFTDLTDLYKVAVKDIGLTQVEPVLFDKAAGRINAHTGSINIDYDTLTKKLGMPLCAPVAMAYDIDTDEKIQCTFYLAFVLDDGTQVYATLYDWKRDVPYTRNTLWQINIYGDAPDSLKEIACKELAKYLGVESYSVDEQINQLLTETQEVA